MIGLVVFSLASLPAGSAQSEAWLIARARAAGTRRRDRLPRGAVDHHDDLRRRRRAQPGARRLGRGRGRRRRRRRAARRRADRAASSWRWVLFVNVPIGLVCAVARAAPARREPRRRPSEHVRHPRRRHGHRRAWRCSSTRSSTPSTPAGDRPRRIAAGSPARVVLLAAFVRDRAAPARAADAVVDLPPAHAARRQRRRAADRHVAVLDVLLHLAVHAAGAALLRAEDRAVLPAARGRDHRLGRRRVGGW